MHLAAHLAALIAVVSTGVVYGTDVFCALVQRPALARVDDATLTAVMGNVHRFGDRRLPVPGILGIIASAAACVLAALARQPVASATAGAALTMLLGWVLLHAPTPHRQSADRSGLAQRPEDSTSSAICCCAWAQRATSTHCGRTCHPAVASRRAM
jgi:hypothetical protein